MDTVMQGLNGMASDPEALATLVSIGIALVLGVIGFLWNAREQKKRYTYETLMKYSENVNYLSAFYNVYMYMTKGGSVDDIAFGSEIERELFFVISYHQSIALAAERNMLDEKIVLAQRYWGMQSIWTYFRPHIEKHRNHIKHPLLYSELEEFIAAKADRYKRFYARRIADRETSLNVNPTKAA